MMYKIVAVTPREAIAPKTQRMAIVKKPRLAVFCIAAKFWSNCLSKSFMVANVTYFFLKVKNQKLLFGEDKNTYE